MQRYTIERLMYKMGQPVWSEARYLRGVDLAMLVTLRDELEYEFGIVVRVVKCA